MGSKTTSFGLGIRIAYNMRAVYILSTKDMAVRSFMWQDLYKMKWPIFLKT